MNATGNKAPDGGEGLSFACSDTVFHISDVGLCFFRLFSPALNSVIANTDLILNS